MWMNIQLRTTCVAYSCHGCWQGHMDAEQQPRLTIVSAGWDFSSRWLADGHSLASCHTTAVVPADLNAMLYQVCWELLPLMVCFPSRPCRWGGPGNSCWWVLTTGHRARLVSLWCRVPAPPSLLSGASPQPSAG